LYLTFAAGEIYTDELGRGSQTWNWAQMGDSWSVTNTEGNCNLAVDDGASIICDANPQPWIWQQIQADELDTAAKAVTQTTTTTNVKSNNKKKACRRLVRAG